MDEFKVLANDAWTGMMAMSFGGESKHSQRPSFITLGERAKRQAGSCGCAAKAKNCPAGEYAILENLICNIHKENPLK